MTRALRRWLGLLLCAVALAASSCAQDRAHAPAPALEPGEWLARIASAHERADAALAAGYPEQARAALIAALELQPPAAVRGDHARVVRQDLGFRVSQLELAGGKPQQALASAERGLALGRRDDLFAANLLVARGRALADLGRDVEAASSYHDALQINAKLLQSALGARRGE